MSGNILVVVVKQLFPVQHSCEEAVTYLDSLVDMLEAISFTI